MKKFFIFILILLLLFGILGYYYYQKNTYSKEVLKLEILGPEEVQAFDQVEYLVRYKNNGNVVLEDVELTFKYPENCLPEEGSLKMIRKSLEDIYPGEQKIASFKARVFGKEGQVEKAEATLKYRPKNLKAFYESNTVFATKIKFVPLTFEIDLPSKIEIKKEIQFYLNYFSNSDWPISDLAIKIDYPLGFEFIDSNPRALQKKEWNLGILNKAEGGRIQIKGRLNGEPKEEKFFRAFLGVWRDNEFIVLKESTKASQLRESAISIFQQINGYSEYVAKAGELLHYEIFFRNIGSEAYENLFLITKLEGIAFDFDSLKVENGQFNRGESSIIWDWREVSKLRFLDRGEEGKVDFWIKVKKDWETDSFKNKNFSLKNQVMLSQTKEEFEIKISSQLEFVQKGFFNDEIFGNSGPLPPRVGETTTYTIIWQVKNYYNDVKNVKVRTTLPANIKLTGKFFPEQASLTFDSDSREVVWTVGDMIAGKGIIDSPPNIAFQISFTPDSSQKNDIALLIGEVKISGEDDWTGYNLEFSSPGITTELPDDSFVSPDQGIVQ